MNANNVESIFDSEEFVLRRAQAQLQAIRSLLGDCHGIVELTGFQLSCLLEPVEEVFDRLLDNPREDRGGLKAERPGS